MIKTRLEIGAEELSALREIMLASPKNSRKRKIARIISVVMVVLMAVFAFASVLNGSIGYALIGLAFAVFFVWVIAGGAKFYQDFIYKKAQSKADGKLKSGFREYGFDDEGVVISSGMGQGFHNWEAFKCWGEFKGYIYLRRIDDQAILVKISDLSSADCEALRALLNTHLAQELSIQ